MMNRLILSSFANDMVELWHNLFQGEKKFIFFIGFCMITFGVPFLLIWLSAVWFDLYCNFCLRKRDPEAWKEARKRHGNNGFRFHRDFRKWLKEEYDPDDVFFKTWRKFDRFGKICLLIWFVFVVLVAIAVIIVDKFDLQI